MSNAINQNKKMIVPHLLSAKKITFLIAILFAACLNNSWAQNTWKKKADVGGLGRWAAVAPGNSCPEPANLRVPKISDTCVRLNWSVPDASVEHIKVSYRPLGTFTWIHDRKKAGENSKWICGLTPGTTYEWKVRNICADDKTGWVHGPDFTTVGLVAWYPFNGNAHDETGNGYNGTVYGATLTDDRFGNAKSAYSFDGINDQISIGKEPNFPSWDTYAVSVWFLNDGGGDQGDGYGQKILSKAQFYTDFHLGVLNDGRVSWWSAQGGFNSVVSNNQDYRDNQWHHVVLNKNSPGSGDIWVDGVLQNSSNDLQAVFNSEDLVIGFTTHRDYLQQKHFSGKIDDIRIYRGVLSESKILDLFTEGNPDFATGASFAFASNTSAVSGGKIPGNIKVQVTPNPSNGNFSVQMQLPAKPTITTLALYNNMGKKVWQQDAGQISGAVYKNISLQNQLPAGIYMMVVQRNDVKLTQKIVISK